MSFFMGVSVGLAVWVALRASRAPDRVRGGFRGAPGSLPGVIPEAFWTSPEGFGGRFLAFREPRGWNLGLPGAAWVEFWTRSALGTLLA